jgi:hypothetical protein
MTNKNGTSMTVEQVISDLENEARSASGRASMLKSARTILARRGLVMDVKPEDSRPPKAPAVEPSADPFDFDSLLDGL